MSFELGLSGKRLVQILAASSGVSIMLYILGAIFNNSGAFYYLIWNLFLAWIPFVLTFCLIRFIKKNSWSSWRGLIITLAWLIFLPNTFYMISDFLHIFDLPSSNVMFNTALLGLFAFNGLVLGYLSLWLIHRQLLLRGHGEKLSWLLVGSVLLASSYAIYLGRYVRLNSWDMITNFSAVLFSVTDQILHPSNYPSILGVVLSFLILLVTVYIVLWSLSSDIIKNNETRISRGNKSRS